jgi:ComF family protein
MGHFSASGWGSLAHLAPPWCRACGAPSRDGRYVLCASCAAPDRFERNLTGRGRLDALRSALAYTDLSAKLILELKYGDRHEHARPFGTLMAPLVKAVGAPAGAVLVPVPLHPRRLGSRRFNQSLLLCHAIAERTGHRIDPFVLRRKNATPPQKGLSFKARYRNVAAAFSAAEKARGLDVVLVDDVLTSGATLVGCARVLRRAGARSVRAVTAARVFPGTEGAQMELPQDMETA